MIEGIVPFVKDKFKILLGATLVLLSVLLLLLSIPVLIYRQFVILLAPYLRSDLDSILTGYTSIFVTDYFKKTAPRSNIVATVYLQGQITCMEMKSLIMEKWITARDHSSGELTYAKFQQYPVRWLGFSFWKNGVDTFSIDNHVYKTHDNENGVTPEEMSDIVEKLLNSKFAPEQSPWEVHVIENYDTGDGEQKTALVFNAHHSLADGFSILTAFLEGLLGYSIDDMGIPVAKFPKRSFHQKLAHNLAVPFYGFFEISNIISHIWRNSPLKILDEQKHRYFVCSKSDPIPIQQVKEIKNNLGVSFTSVILSAISSGLHQFLENQKKTEKDLASYNNNPVLCLSTLPAVGYTINRKLTNDLTVAVFELPIRDFKTPVDRVRAVFGMLEKAKNSVVPILLLHVVNFVGAHLHPVSEAVVKNRMVSTGLTNFPTVPMKIELNGKPVVDMDFVTGANDGDGYAGVGIMTLSYDQHIRLGIIAEKGLMSRTEAKKTLEYATEEIRILRKLMQKN